MSLEPSRRQVAERAGGRCEYCRCPASHVPDDFAVEHVTPRAVGGTDDMTNLAWSCQGCNSRKFVAQTGIDPLTAETATLYHPRLSGWGEHFAWNEDTLSLVGKTPTGRATVERLKLNRTNVVNLRRALIAVDLHPPPAG